MFRVMTSNIQRPAYFLLCDDRYCGATYFMPLQQAADEEAAAQQQSAYLQAATKAGWMVCFDSQFCPAHHQAIRDAVARIKPLVQPASPQEKNVVERMMKDRRTQGLVQVK